jgi:hypothetical protein
VNAARDALATAGADRQALLVVAYCARVKPMPICPADGLRLFDVRRDLPDAWSEVEVWASAEPSARRLPLRLGEAMFPVVPAHRVRWLTGLHLFFAAPNADPSRQHVIGFERGGASSFHDKPSARNLVNPT